MLFQMKRTTMLSDIWGAYKIKTRRTALGSAPIHHLLFRGVPLSDAPLGDIIPPELRFDDADAAGAAGAIIECDI